MYPPFLPRVKDQGRNNRSNECEIRTQPHGDEKMMKLDTLKDYLYDVVGAIYETHRELGPGLNEYVYQEGLEIEFKAQDIFYEREKEFHPTYRGEVMEATYRLDFLCFCSVIVECKAVKKITSEHRAQLFNYLRLTKSQAGVLVNFAKRYVEVERYFYDSSTEELKTYDGKPFVIEDDI